MDDLEEVCDVECRLAQRYSLSFICPSNNIEPFVEVRNLQGDVQVCQLGHVDKEHPAMHYLGILRCIQSIKALRL